MACLLASTHSLGGGLKLVTIPSLVASLALPCPVLMALFISSQDTLGRGNNGKLSSWFYQGLSRIFLRWMNRRKLSPGNPGEVWKQTGAVRKNPSPGQSEVTLRSDAALPDLAIIHSSLSLVPLKCLSDSPVCSNEVFFNLAFLFFSAESRISVSLCTLEINFSCYLL